MQHDDVIYHYEYTCPFGTLVLASHGGFIVLARWKSAGDVWDKLTCISSKFGCRLVAGHDATIDNAIHRIDDYVSGRSRSLDAPVQLHGTDFQKVVWHKACEIPYGSVVSYAWLATAVGRSTAVRAVANALGANPCALFVPCHRIVGSNGKLTGYAGGTEIKQQLLAIESAL